jgi:uncharacterized protein
MARKTAEPPRAWQRMLSGRRLDLIDPSPLDIEIEDIAHGLARVARWNGQTRGEHAFSVAQHCLLVLDILRRGEAGASTAKLLMALLHDAPEYVVGDMISPFKAVIGGDYKAVEDRLLSAIHVRFGLAATTPPVWKRDIKRADAIAAWHEATSLAGFAIEEADRHFPRPDKVGFSDMLLEPMSPRDAQAAYLEAFRLLDAARSPVSRMPV